MRIGIFGGTFDPVHMGHLRAAEEIREYFSLAKVYFVPANIPPHKNSKEITNSETRFRMIKTSIRGNPYLRASETEMKRKGYSYSIDTIQAFEKRFESLYFIIGMDAFSEINTWHKYKEIFYHTNFIIMIRPMNEQHEQPVVKNIFPTEVEKNIKKIDNFTFQHVSGNITYLHRVTQLDISSTMIRENVKNGKTIRYIVPERVRKIINEKKLYGI